MLTPAPTIYYRYCVPPLISVFKSIKKAANECRRKSYYYRFWGWQEEGAETINSQSSSRHTLMSESVELVVRRFLRAYSTSKEVLPPCNAWFFARAIYHKIRYSMFERNKNKRRLLIWLIDCSSAQLPLNGRARAARRVATKRQTKQDLLAQT